MRGTGKFEKPALISRKWLALENIAIVVRIVAPWSTLLLHRIPQTTAFFTLLLERARIGMTVDPVVAGVGVDLDQAGHPVVGSRAL